MKKNILLLFLFLGLGPGRILAQEGFQFGFGLNPTLSWMQTDRKKSVTNEGSIIGVKLQIAGEYYFKENYAIKTGLALGFSQGGKLAFTDGGKVFTRTQFDNPALQELPPGTVVTYRMQMLEFPFSLKLRTNEFGYKRFFVEMPVITIGFVTGAYGDFSVSDGDKENIKRDVNTVNLSWGLGAGMEYAISSTTSLVTGIFYNSGFTDITADRGSDKSKGKVSNLELRMGVNF